jgi:hypothetical protein
MKNLTLKGLIQLLNEQTKMENAVVILKPKRDEIEKVEFQTKPTLKDLQTLVGGYIEVVPKNSFTEQFEYLFLVNEEGIMRQLDFNHLAYRLFGDKLYGNVLIVKPEVLE